MPLIGTLMALNNVYRLSSSPLDTSLLVVITCKTGRWILTSNQWSLFLDGVELLLRQVSDVLPQLTERSNVPYVAYINQFLKNTDNECHY